MRLDTPFWIHAGFHMKSALITATNSDKCWLPGSPGCVQTHPELHKPNLLYQLSFQRKAGTTGSREIHTVLLKIPGWDDFIEDF